MASQMTRNRRGRSKSKEYKQSSPGSHQAGARLPVVQFWTDHRGNGYRTRREALAANRRDGVDKLPVMKRI